MGLLETLLQRLPSPLPCHSSSLIPAPTSPHKGRAFDGEAPPLGPPPCPPLPPKGHLAVYVSGGTKGEEVAPPRRFVVPVIDFNHPLFVELLREAEEEFGFDHPGGITIPCPVSRFERVRTRIAAELARTGLRVNRS